MQRAIKPERAEAAFAATSGVLSTRPHRAGAPSIERRPHSGLGTAESHIWRRPVKRDRPCLSGPSQWRSRQGSMPRWWWDGTAVDAICYIPVHRGLEIQRINVHHLDGAPRLRGHQDAGRHPSVSRKGQPPDQLFVSRYPIVRRRQHPIDPLQVEGPVERHGPGGRPHRHQRGSPLLVNTSSFSGTVR